MRWCDLSSVKVRRFLRFAHRYHAEAMMSHWRAALNVSDIYHVYNCDWHLWHVRLHWHLLLTWLDSQSRVRVVRLVTDLTSAWARPLLAATLITFANDRLKSSYMHAGQPDSHRSAESRLIYSFIHDIWGKKRKRRKTLTRRGLPAPHPNSNNKGSFIFVPKWDAFIRLCERFPNQCVSMM